MRERVLREEAADLTAKLRSCGSWFGIYSVGTKFVDQHLVPRRDTAACTA